MKRSSSGGGYPLAFTLLLAVLLVLGAYALVLLSRGDPAFPVFVFGSARSHGGEAAARAIRPPTVGELPHGSLDRAELLPLPAQVAAAAAGGEEAPTDPILRSLAPADQLILERAREAARLQRSEVALALYDRLGERSPGNRAVLIEHASVLASLGLHERAARTIERRAAHFGEDVELELLRARNLWWAALPYAADSALTHVLSLLPAHPIALQLRRTVRASTEPDVHTARRWLAGSGGTFERLMLARALVRDGQFALALPHYRVVSDSDTIADLLVLEAASAAAAADSIEALDRFTRSYIARHPYDVSARLALARAYSWRGDYRPALLLYDELVALSPAADLLFERANVRIWADRGAEAEADLVAVLQRQPRNARAQELLGDLAHYRGDSRLALSRYESAHLLDPGVAGLPAKIATARQQLEQARLASLPHPEPTAYATGIEAFSDNQGFHWVVADGQRSFRHGRSVFQVTAERALVFGEPPVGEVRNPGFGFSGEAAVLAGERVQLRGGAGVRSFQGVATLPHWFAGVSIYRFLGSTVTADYIREPAALRAASMLALQARARSDRVKLTAAREVHRFAISTQIEAERITSSVGDARRLLGYARIARPLDQRFTVAAALNTAFAEHASPAVTGWGPLVWSPRHYFEPSIELGYQRALGADFTAAAAVSFGYGFVSERTHDRRFPQTAIPTAGANVDVSYAKGPWSVSAGVRHGGAIGEGYRATTLRLHASYRLGTR